MCVGQKTRKGGVELKDCSFVSQQLQRERHIALLPCSLSSQQQCCECATSSVPMECETVEQGWQAVTRVQVKGGREMKKSRWW